MRAGAARALLALIVILYASETMAKLVFRTDDVYVRGADLIVVADTVTRASDDSIPVAVVESTSVILGIPSGPHIQVRSYRESDEDMPVFRVGQRSLLFLIANHPSPGIYSCVGGGAGKRDYTPERAPGWETRVARVKELARVRQLATEDARLAALIHLLDSDDTQLAAAASNYLNQIVTGNDDEDWVIRPPKDSSDWSWDDYFERNVVAHRQHWKRWWLARSRS